jgi:hypothetical protein
MSTPLREHAPTTAVPVLRVRPVRVALAGCGTVCGELARLLHYRRGLLSGHRGRCGRRGDWWAGPGATHSADGAGVRAPPGDRQQGADRHSRARTAAPDAALLRAARPRGRPAPQPRPRRRPHGALRRPGPPGAARWGHAARCGRGRAPTPRYAPPRRSLRARAPGPPRDRPGRSSSSSARKTTALSGLPSSWATPPVKRPSAANFSAWRRRRSSAICSCACRIR